MHVLDRWAEPHPYLTLSGLRERVRLHVGDCRDLDLLRVLLARTEADTVFHLAAQPLVALGNAAPYETLSINVMGTVAVLEAVRTVAPAARVVFASSGAVYGPTSTDHAIGEDEPPVPANNVYAAGKIAADTAVRTYAKVYGLKAAACRFMNTYGPGDTNFSRIVPKACRALIEARPYDFGDRDDGRSVLDFLHIRDMAAAYIAVADRIDAAAGEAFNFGAGSPISVRELVGRISRAFDGREREAVFRGAPKPKRPVKYLNISKSERVLGWTPTTPLETGLAETLEWYRRHWDRL